MHQSLRQALSNLRRSLPASVGDIISTSADTIALVDGVVSDDVSQFLELAVSARTPDLRRAVELADGELLEGFDARSSDFDDWLTRERIGLRERRLDAIAQRYGALPVRSVGRVVNTPFGLPRARGNAALAALATALAVHAEFADAMPRKELPGAVTRVSISSGQVLIDDEAEQTALDDHAETAAVALDLNALARAGETVVTDCGRLAATLSPAIGDAVRDESFVDGCIARSAGNPWFLEQLLRTGVQPSGTVPDSVHGVVAARLDALDAAGPARRADGGSTRPALSSYGPARPARRQRLRLRRARPTLAFRSSTSPYVARRSHSTPQASTRWWWLIRYARYPMS